MVWLPDGEKKLKICLFVLTQCTNVTDTQTDKQTPHDGIDRAYAYSIARQKLTAASNARGVSQIAIDN